MDICLREYETLYRYDEDWAGLQRYLIKNGLESVVTVFPYGIKANSHIGVIKAHNLRIEILPKLIADDNEADTILRNLIFMLSYTRRLNIKTADDILQGECKNPFLEVLIREFAVSLSEGLKRDIPHSYVTQCDNINYLKGKLKFPDHLRHNVVNKARFYCKYDRFSEDNPLNQLLLFVTVCLSHICKNSRSRQILYRIRRLYANVSLRPFNKDQAGNITLQRNQKMFEKPLKLARMFLSHAAVDMSGRQFESFALLWDMNKLFEEFVYEILKRNRDGIVVAAQKCKTLLKEECYRKRNTFVDILVTSPEKIVIDTKYKKITVRDGFAMDDAAQVITYCLLHQAQKAILIYPQWGENAIGTGYKHLNCETSDYQLKVGTINLQRRRLTEECVKQELVRIVSEN